MLMDHTVDILRGWPYDGALDLTETIATGSSLSMGDWVEAQANGTVAVTSSTATNNAGLVLQGNADSASSVNSNKAVVLWSNWIGKVSNYTAGTYAPGDKLTVISGKLAKAGSSDPVIGFVKAVVAASATTTAHLVVVIK